ncbi:MAG TPA: hypothetical protein VM690_08090, partial [Gaiellaceae bacterium]|nr:hypothetical protein [Gaiellaceae bacterium]
MSDVRQAIVAAARWGIRNEPLIHYAEVRPIPLARRLPITTDCSGFVTLCYFLAGAPDPNGREYDGEGWTGTLLRHMTHVEEPRAADCVRRGDQQRGPQDRSSAPGAGGPPVRVRP